MKRVNEDNAALPAEPYVLIHIPLLIKAYALICLPPITLNEIHLNTINLKPFVEDR